MMQLDVCAKCGPSYVLLVSAKLLGSIPSKDFRRQRSHPNHTPLARFSPPRSPSSSAWRWGDQGATMVGEQPFQNPELGNRTVCVYVTNWDDPLAIGTEGNEEGASHNGGRRGKRNDFGDADGLEPVSRG
eukprot:scaffold160682_cov26-Tisochrysis_lutea.AAC.1